MRFAWIFLVLAALVAAARVYTVIRKMRAASGRDDIDERLVKSMREGGMDMFAPTDVDFFFGVETQQGSDSLRAALEGEGYAVDAKLLEGEAGSGYSLHARRSLRVTVTEMQELSRHFTQLAAAHEGHYDGWAAAGMQLPRRLASTPSFLPKGKRPE
ncbi:MAG: ribonuclease E inhibitor RraB [Steroidobacteraceae bacterium]